MNILKYLSFCLFVLALTSCYKDKGDYDYHGVNDVTIRDTTAMAYTVLQFDTLTIKPVIAAAQSEATLKYEWTAREINPNNATGQFTVYNLSNEAVLRKQISLVPSKYRVILRATDSTTNISSYLFYEVTVGTNLSEGWMFLQQFTNSGDLSLLAPTGRLFNNVYQGANGVPLSKDVHTIEVNVTSTPREIYIMQGDSAVEVNPSSFGRIKSFNNWFFSAPATVKPGRNLVFAPPTVSNRMGIMINNGLVHIKRFGGFPGDVLYGSELLLDGAANYNVSRQIMIGDFNASRYLAAFYDTKGKRFLGLRGGTYDITGNMVHFPDSVAGTAFDANKVDMDLLYAGATGQNYIYNTILKHTSGDCYLYRLNLNTATGAMLKQKMNAENVGALTAAVSSLQLEYIYYGEANKVHMYEIGPNAASTIYSFAAGETITAMTIESRTPTTLMIATYDGSKGRVYQCSLDINGRFVGDTYQKVYEGFGKVVQIKYKVQ